MKTGQNSLYFIPLNESADERSRGRVVSWINSWWKYRTGAARGGRTVKRLSPDNWFDMHIQDMPRLWTHPREEIETVVGVFNKYRLAHPHIPHVFAIPRLMTHLWIRQLSK